mgnify:CR=1 FL=1
MPGSGYATISRKKILEFLKKNSDRTVAVADIDHYLRTQDCEVNITTIYRYLDKLAKAINRFQDLYVSELLSTKGQ